MAESSSEAASSSASVAAESTTTTTMSGGPSTAELEKSEDFLEPERKKRKQSSLQGSAQVNQEGQALSLPHKPEQKLEHRLGGILCCVVCFDLPRSAVYQVSHHQFTLFHYIFFLFLAYLISALIFLPTVSSFLFFFPILTELIIR